MASTWKTPTVVEVACGLEIGAYAPAELEVEPRAGDEGNEARTPHGLGPAGQSATPRRRPTSS